MSSVVLIAGPNGAGKTTFARHFLKVHPQFGQFVNADIMAQGLSPSSPESAAIAAGRLIISTVDALAEGGESFVLETTLSGGWLDARVEDWRAKGCEIGLIYLKLAGPELAIQRVRARVARGGHDIPEETVRRRFVRSLERFETVYRPLADWGQIYDNSGIMPAMTEEWGHPRP
ncbi:MAG: hypothetical protein AMXMBFR81_24510 [Chthonomonas sp.]